MTIHVPAARRGILTARADAGDVTALVNDLNTAFAEFKEARDREIKEIKAKQADVVTGDKVDRINAEITSLQKALDETNAALAAQRLGGGAGDGGTAPTAEQREHAKAFDRFFRRGVDAGLRDLEASAALRTTSDPDGGYLVPEEMESTIDRVLSRVSTFRSLATVRQTRAPTYKKLVNMGGAAAGWVGEEEARPETSGPKLRELELTVMELFANPATTQRMLDDGIVDVAAWLADEVNITFAEMESAAFINGDGVRKPRGILNYPKAANTSYAWGKVGFVTTGAAADFVSTAGAQADCLLDLVFALREQYRGMGTFLMNDTTMAKIRKFKDGDGNYIWAPPANSEGVPTIFGKPVRTDDFMPAVGANEFPVAFGDFRRAYMILDRIGVRVLRDDLTNKPYVHFYTTKRVGGGVTNFEAVKLLKVAS